MTANDGPPAPPETLPLRMELAQRMPLDDLADFERRRLNDSACVSRATVRHRWSHRAEDGCTKPENRSTYARQSANRAR